MSDFARLPVTAIELDCDTCQNTYGVSPCTAGRVESGTAQAGSSTSLTLAAGASAVDDVHNNRVARLTSGAGSVQERVIADYNGTSKVATVSPRWATNQLSYPSQFDNAAWQKNSVTVAPGVMFASGEAVDTNLLSNSDDMLGAGWSGTASGVANGDGTWTFTDDNAAQWEFRQATGTLKPHQPIGFVIELKKDGIGRATRFSTIKCVPTGGGAHYISLDVDTSTGEYHTFLNGTGLVLVNAGVENTADYWRAWMIFYTTDAAVTGFQYQYFPAAGSGIAWTSSASILGSSTVRRPQVLLGDQLRGYIGTSGAPITAAQSADKIIETTSNSIHDIVRLNVSGSVDGDTCVVVAEVKKAERVGVQLYFQRRDTTPSWNVTFFDFDTQTFTGTTPGCTAGIQVLLDGWYRIWLKGPLNSGTSIPDWGLRLILTMPFTTTYTGDGVSGAYAVRAQMEFNVDVGDFIDGGASAIVLPDATTVYDIIDRPAACYNTFKTCQDKPNYVRGTKTYKFVTTGAPVPAGEALRPYIKTLKFAPTEIDPDAGIARRASVSVTMFDEPCPDVEADPYIDNRAAVAGGTFWSRFFARNHNYSGRWARLKRAYLTGAWNWADFTTELYQIEAMKGPSSRDEITLTLKDPLKFTDRVKVPRPTSGKLAVVLGTNDLQLTLGALEGGDYPANGYVRVGDQVIRYADKKVAAGWNFSAESEGWAATNATVTHNATSVTLTPTAADPQWAKSSGMSFAGGNNRYVHVHLKRVSGTASWEGRLYYATSGHGFSGSYYKDIAAPAGIDADFITATWDMSALTAGGNDWMANDITGLRLDVDSGSSAVYEIDWIAYSDSPSYDADVLAWPNSTYRSQFGTTAVAAKIGDGVQLCQVWVDVPLTTVVQDLCNLSGIDNAYIDSAGLAVEESNWLGAKYRVTACLVEPEDVSALLGELAIQANAAIWWHPVDQKVKFKVIGPQPPTAIVANTLTDEANLIEGSVQVTPLDDLRLTFAGIYYDIATATANRKEAKSYLRGDLYIDADAESTNEYGDRRQDIKYSRWFTAANASAMKAFASRRIAYYRDAPKKIEFRLDAKDAAIEEGALYDINTDQIVDFDGNPQTVRALITKREDRGNDIAVTARTTVFARRYAFIAAAGAPDYLAASEAQRGYAYICNASGKMSNGDDGYLII